MKDRLILLVTDAGFLMPTMSVAAQVAAQPSVMAQADILCVLIDIEEETASLLATTFAALPVQFKRLSSDAYALPDTVSFNATGVPRSTLARFEVGALIPDQYEHIIYLDGDVQIVGDIAPLVMHDVAPGHIAAANDALWLSEGDASRYWRQSKDYLQGIGVDRARNYFNAGVLLFRRETWLDLSQAAKSYFLNHSDVCRFHDQSALNHVTRHKREHLSPAWNFITNYAEIGLHHMVEPRIIHFTGPRKPWFYPGSPWRGRFLDHYRDFVTRYPVLAPFVRQPAPIAAASWRKYERRYRLMRMLMPWRRRTRAARFRRYLENTHFVR